MLTFIFFLLVAGLALVLGARYHNQVNVRIANLFGKGQELPPDFELWLANHKGEYDTIGKAIGAWADAKYGTKYDSILK